MCIRDRVLDCINVSDVSWTISYHNDEASMMAKASELNIDPARAEFIRLSDLK